jgi:hypothetical protein
VNEPIQVSLEKPTKTYRKPMLIPVGKISEMIQSGAHPVCETYPLTGCASSG